MNKWDQRFMEMAWVVSKWASCFKENRQVGAIIVKDKRILTTGYNGAPSNVSSCKERGKCIRQELGIESGTRGELCYAVHAEQNAVIQAARLGVSLEDATLYCTHQPCSICTRIIINSGIKRVVFDEPYPDTFSVELFNEAGVELVRYKDLF